MPIDINELRRLLETGAITETDIENLAISGSSSNPPNELSALMQRAEGYGPPEPSEQQRFATLAPEMQREANLPMNSMRNEQTGQVTYFGPQGASARPYGDTERGLSRPGMRQAVMGTDGIFEDRGQAYEGPAPEIDYSRPGIEIAGKGKGPYTKDGDAVIQTRNGPQLVRLNVDRQATAAAAKAAFDRARAEADLAGRNATTAKTLEEIADSRTKRAEAQRERELLGGGVPQSMLEKFYGKAPDGMRWSRDGFLEEIPGAEGAKLTEGQGKALSFGSRVANSHEVLNAIGADGKVQPSLFKRAAESLPDWLGAGALGMSVNKLPEKLGGPSAAQQMVEQAERDFINAVLRRESGAVISPSEFANARLQYFPQPGDSPQVIAQKRRNREIVRDSLADEAGPAKRKVLGMGDRARAMFDAKTAIARGVPRQVIQQRLSQLGFSDVKF